MAKVALRSLYKLSVCALLVLLVGYAPWGGRELVVQSWAARPVLVMLHNGPGFMEEDRAWEVMPRLVIYADGTFIRARYDFQEGGRPAALERGQIAPADVCALLRKLDDTGFLSLDPADYEAPGIMHAGTTPLKVDAWRSNQVSAYALPYALGTPHPAVKQVEVPEPLPEFQDAPKQPLTCGDANETVRPGTTPVRPTSTGD